MRLSRLLFTTFTFISSLAHAVNVPPEIVQQGVAPVLRRAGVAKNLDLAPLFRDPDVTGSAVRVSVRIGSTTKNVDLALYDAAKPITVANFLAYVDAGHYQNNFCHRAVPGFIVQDGGFRWTVDNNVEPVPGFAAIQNEPGISNLRGTIAMAKLGGDPNSATNQWFVNLANNSANLDAQNGGFTVFGRVVGNGMAVMDEVAVLPRVNAGGAFTDLPVKDHTGGNVNRVHTVETNAARIPVLAYSATSDDAALVAVSITGTTLRLTPAASRFGSTMVHVTATDLDGAAVTMNLAVDVIRRSTGWHVETGPNEEVTLVFNPADTSVLPEDSFAVDFGSRLISEPASRTFSIRNDSAAPLSGITVASSGANAAEFVVTSGAGPTNVAGGATVSFAVDFTPAATGGRSAVVRVNSPDPEQPTLDLVASGTGTEIPPPVFAGVAPQAFGAAADDTLTMPDLRGTVVTASDPRGVVSFTQTPLPGAVLSVGNYTLSFSATNSAGKTATAQTTLAVQAVPPPVFAGVAAQTLFAGATGSVVMPDLRGTVVTATDLRGVTAFSQMPLPGASLGLGDYTLSFSATNSAGKTATAQTTLAVRFGAVSEPRVTVASAYTGAPLPPGTTGLPAGSLLSAFGTPAISDLRAMASRVTIAAGRTKLAAIYVEDVAGLGRIAAVQGGAAGVTGATFKSFLDPLLSPQGKVAFGAKLSGVKGTEDEGVWTDLFGSAAPLLREGSPVQGLAFLKLKSVLSISLTDNALIALVKLAPTPGFVTPENDVALLRITGASSGTLLARTGSGLLGSTVKKLSTFQPASASAGQGRWHGASDTIAKLTLADKRIVLVKIDSSGVQTPLIRTNQASVGFAPLLTTLGVPDFGGPGMAILAQKTAQPGVTNANDSVLLHSANGTAYTELLGEQAGFGNFAAFSDPVTNGDGDIAFLGTRRGDVARAPMTNALWLSDGVGAPEIVAALGTAATDRDGSAIADTAWSKFMTFAMPDNGGPVFIAQVKGRAVTGRNKLGMWARDPAGVLREILRTGEDIALPTGTKQLSGFTLLNALPGSFGARRSYNSAHSLAVQATFADRTQALLRVEVP